MPSNYPFSEILRNQIANDLVFLNAGEEPLTFVRQRIFRRNPAHIGGITAASGRTLGSFYKDVVRYCEMAAWAEDPALIIELLTVVTTLQPDYAQIIESLKQEGPFRCHPSGFPQFVCRVATELPLFNRDLLRQLAMGFDTRLPDNEGKRVLLTNGPTGSGKTYTGAFFRYLATIQPQKVGVLMFDFGAEELLTQSANLNIPVELFLAQKLERQARERRAELTAQQQVNMGGGGLIMPPLSEQPFEFQPFANEQQRARWTRSLVKDLVTKVLLRLVQIPSWWVLVFDNCEKAPKEIEQFMQSLIEITAGTDIETAKAADAGCARVVLLGDSKNLLPATFYQNHIFEEDLSQDKIEKLHIKNYFVRLGLSKGFKIAEDDLAKITDDCFDKTQKIMTEQGLTAENWLKIMTMVVIEKTLQLEKIAGV